MIFFSKDFPLFVVFVIPHLHVDDTVKTPGNVSCLPQDLS